MPIRWRLTLWFSLILFVALIVSGIIIHTVLQRSLNNDIDDTLRIYSEQVHGTLDIDDITQPLDYSAVCSCMPSFDTFASPGMFLQLIDEKGNILAYYSTVDFRNYRMR